MKVRSYEVTFHPMRPVTDTTETSERPSGTGLAVTPSTPVIGAEISGVDLREPLPSEVSGELRQLLARYKVLFFRDQEIDTRQQLAFARSFGSILHFRSVRDDHPEHPGVHVVTGNATQRRADGGRNTGFWHIDATSLVAAPFASVLRAVAIPPVGGDTIWANLAAAYEGLPDELKQAVDGVATTHHAPGPPRESTIEYPLISRPLVRTHPETNEKILFLNLMLRPWVVGWNQDESDELIRKLQDEVTRPEYQVRFRWSPGAVAMWDNRAVHHYGVNDYGDFPRRMERILITEPELPLPEQLI